MTDFIQVALNATSCWFACAGLNDPIFNDLGDQTKKVSRSPTMPYTLCLLHRLTLFDPNPAHDGVASHIPQGFSGEQAPGQRQPGCA